jgi:hypothetical protein
MHQLFAFLRPIALASFLLHLLQSTALACPFCAAVKPTLSQQRETATVVALGEVTLVQEKDRTFRVHHVAVGKSQLESGGLFHLTSDQDLKPGSFALLLAEENTQKEQLDWSAIPMSDLCYAYFSKAPGLRTAADERLRYFAKYLEHDDRQIAEDAYLEFAHAPFDVVAKVVPSLDVEKLRQWLADDAVPQARKGLYGLCLGLSGKERAENAKVLRQLVESPGSDFRAGLDGVFGGFLVAEGEAALQTIEEKFFCDPKSAVGHVRHAMSALRFYQEYGKDIPVERLRQAFRHLLDRPEFAAAAILDLARWEDWKSLPRVAAIYSQKEFGDLPTRKAVVQFLLVCPTDAAAAQLRQLRERDRQFIDAVERQVNLQSGK